MANMCAAHPHGLVDLALAGQMKVMKCVCGLNENPDLLLIFMMI